MTMTIDDAQILAWLDGELDESAAEIIEEAIQADSVLMVRAELHYLTMMRLKEAFAPTLALPPLDWPAKATANVQTEPTAPAPETKKLEPQPIDEPGRGDVLEKKAKADAAAEVVALPEPPKTIVRPASRPRGLAAIPRRSLLLWTALAGVLIVGLLLGRWTAPRPPAATSLAARGAVPLGGAIVNKDGGLIASGPLAETLEHGLGREEAGPVHVALSFRDKTGRLCRSFDTERLAGIACRDPDSWHVQLVLQANGSNGATARRSASSESPFVGQAIDAMIAGDPLDAGEEQTARDRGWR
jgi:hypothetical protein